MAQFSRYLGIDYSGAGTPEKSLTGLRVFSATPTEEPREIAPPPSPRKYFTRSVLAEWLVRELREGPPTLVGIDHGFSFPWRYFQKHQIPADWDAFLHDFHRHWPTDGRQTYVDFIREGELGNGDARRGDSKWRRLVEQRCRAKSVFHFDVQGSVAKATHAGLPWLLHLRRELGRKVHFWPFDGWNPAPGISVVAEVYPALWSRSFPREGRNGHQQDAYSVARWMRERDGTGELRGYFGPPASEEERTLAEVEGWILGVEWERSHSS
jgi:hypothetical protein